MNRQGTPDGTPSEDAVEHDFSMPGDADLRPEPDEPADGDEDDA